VVEVVEDRGQTGEGAESSSALLISSKTNLCCVESPFRATESEDRKTARAQPASGPSSDRSRTLLARSRWDVGRWLARRSTPEPIGWPGQRNSHGSWVPPVPSSAVAARPPGCAVAPGVRDVVQQFGHQLIEAGPERCRMLAWPNASVATASKYCPLLPHSLSSLRITFDRRPFVSTCSVVRPPRNRSAKLQSPHVSLVRIDDADSNHRQR